MDFKINNKNYIIMKTDYRFWEQNVNPITMQPDDKKNYTSSWDLEEMGKAQRKKEALEERRVIREEIKKANKFW